AVADCERLRQLAPNLAEVLEGRLEPEGVKGRIDYAVVCHSRGYHRAAARLYAAAFAAEPRAAENMADRHRYTAARAAACAGTTAAGGKDAPTDQEERARWRRQSLDWLRADLAVLTAAA